MQIQDAYHGFVAVAYFVTLILIGSFLMLNVRAHAQCMPTPARKL